MSSIEVEYTTTFEVTKQVMWLSSLFETIINQTQIKSFVIYDNN